MLGGLCIDLPRFILLKDTPGRHLDRPWEDGIFTGQGVGQILAGVQGSAPSTIRKVPNTGRMGVPTTLKMDAFFWQQSLIPPSNPLFNSIKRKTDAWGPRFQQMMKGKAKGCG